MVPTVEVAIIKLCLTDSVVFAADYPDNIIYLYFAVVRSIACKRTSFTSLYIYIYTYLFTMNLH